MVGNSFCVPTNLRLQNLHDPGERALQEQVFINTYICPLVTDCPLVPASGLQRRVAGAAIGEVQVCVVHVGATQDHRVDCLR